IVFGDMGPIVSDFSRDGAFYNDTFTSDGTREFNGFVVEFDRPVEIASFTGDDVTVAYRDTVTTASNPPNLIVTGDAEFTITALDAGSDFCPGLQSPDSDLMATQFLVSLNTPLSGVGTYSYAIAPDIHDNIRKPNTTGGALATF